MITHIMEYSGGCRLTVTLVDACAELYRWRVELAVWAADYEEA